MRESAFAIGLREWRAKRNLSLAALARMVNYSKGYLSKIENGEKPPTADLARRCDEGLGAGGRLLMLLSVPGNAGTEGEEANSSTRSPEWTHDRCPYPGLAAFEAQDAPWFFGREKATAELIDRLTDCLHKGGHLTVVAPSGAGKSSLLKAGLLLVLAQGALPCRGSRHWPVSVFTPTSDPVERLVAAVAESGGVQPEYLREALAAGVEPFRAAVSEIEGRPERLVLVVDQFEEVFTLCDERSRRDLFIDALCALAARRADGEPLALVVTGVRADFYGHLLHHPGLARSVREQQVALAPMQPDEVRAAIVKPADLVGLDLEPGLVELLLRDLGAPPGARQNHTSRGPCRCSLTHC